MKKLTQAAASLAEWIPTMRIVPPLHEDFSVYGNADVNRRAREWAYVNRIALVRNLPACVHGFYMMRCPGRCSSLGALDHAELWVDCDSVSLNRPDKIAKPFLLSHPYVKAPHRDPELVAYAQAHGVDIEEGHFHDHWYGPTAPPVRLTSHSVHVPFPLEVALPSVLTLSPIRWRCEKVMLTETAALRCQRDTDHRGECSPDEDDHETFSFFPPGYPVGAHDGISEDDRSS